jgi:hypothetical protein
MARRDAYIKSDHMLVVIKFRARICHASNTKPQQLRRFAVDRLRNRSVASRYYDELESDLPGVQVKPLSLDEKCKKLEETIQRVVTNTIGYTTKQANKEWFDEECAKVNKEKNAAREQAIKNNTREAKNPYKLAQTKDWHSFRKRQGSSTKFFKRLNDVRRPFEPQLAYVEPKTGNY